MGPNDSSEDNDEDNDEGGDNEDHANGEYEIYPAAAALAIINRALLLSMFLNRKNI